MPFDNPYEPPAIPAEVLEPEWPTTGVYRDRSFVVMHYAAKMPPICVRTGKPADKVRPLELVGGMPNDGSVPATGKKWYGDKYYRIEVPLHGNAVLHNLLLRRLGYGMAFVCLLGLLLGAWFYRELRPRDWLEQAMVWLLLGLVAAVGFLAESRRLLRLECIAREYLWISQAPKAYLRQLPPWPVPRPSWWRRALFGPAGIAAPARRKASGGA